MRYAYAITAALIAGGATASIIGQAPLGAQVAQNEPGTISAAAPKVGAPMSFADLTAKLAPAVVNISTTQKVQVPQQRNPFAGTPFGELFRQFQGGGGDDDGDNGGGGAGNGQSTTREAQSLGSGFIVSPDGYIVTNNHVISGIPTEQGKVTISSITVTLPDRKEYKATVVGKDAASDLAVLKIDARGLPFVKFGDSTHTRVGDWVLAIGNPYALGGTVTAGIVSAIHRSIGQNSGAYDRYIQTDAAINQGNSGGPMFDLNGNVVGINTLIYSPSGGNVGIGFAIPAEQAKPVVDQLMKGQRIARGYLGVGIQQVDDDIAAALGLPKNHGEIIRTVEPGQPAARAGIRQGDVIVRVNNQDVTPDNTLSYIVANTPIGRSVPVELIRDGKHLTLNVNVAQRPPEEQIAAANGGGGGDVGKGDDNGAPGNNQGAKSMRAALGLSVQTLTPDVARQLGLALPVRGVVVTSVDPSSDAGNKGVKPKDVILQISQRPVTTVADAAAAVEAARRSGLKTVLLLIQRGNTPASYIGLDFEGN